MPLQWAKLWEALVKGKLSRQAQQAVSLQQVRSPHGSMQSWSGDGPEGDGAADEKTRGRQEG
jgi:hypothetical protein